LAELNDHWQRYAAWLAANAVDAARTLLLGASAAPLDDFAGKAGLTLPDQFRALYKIHDGQPWDGLWVFPEGQWMPLGQIEEALGQVREPGLDWPDPWLPFIFDGGSSYLVVDCDTAAVHVAWFDDDPERVAGDVVEWLGSVADRAEAGRVTFDPKHGVTERG
jgi:cell wall assembly regulator SMI1